LARKDTEQKQFRIEKLELLGNKKINSNKSDSGGALEEANSKEIKPGH